MTPWQVRSCHPPNPIVQVQPHLCNPTRPVRARGMHPSEARRRYSYKFNGNRKKRKALTFAVLLLPVQIHGCRLMMDSWLDGVTWFKCLLLLHRGNSCGSVRFIVSLLGGESSQNYAQAGRLHTSTFSLSLLTHTHTHTRTVTCFETLPRGWGGLG